MRWATTELSRRRLLGLTVPLGVGWLAACSSPNGGASSTPAEDPFLARPAQEQWPAPFRRASPEVQEAYRYAVAHPEILQYMPCYCGCVNAGHASNKDCYIDEVRPDGSVLLDPMSFA